MNVICRSGKQSVQNTLRGIEVQKVDFNFL